MGQSVDAKVAYGFSVIADSTPDALEDYGPYGDGDFSPLLDVSYYGWADFQTPVVYIKSTEAWAMDGSPTEIESQDFTPEELRALTEAREEVLQLLKDSGEYDENDRWSVKLGEIGWLVWGSFG